MAAPGAFDIMEVSNFLLENIRSGGNIGALQGWDREPKKLWPTLQRTALEDAWGFSLVGGLDYLEAAGRYSGIVTQRGDVGLWLKVIPPFFNNLQKGNLIRLSEPEYCGIRGDSSYLAFFSCVLCLLLYIHKNLDYISTVLPKRNVTSRSGYKYCFMMQK